MKNNIKPKIVPAPEGQSVDAPAAAFEPFEWIPEAMVGDDTEPARELASLANHVLDVARGVALVFELAAELEIDTDCGQPTFLGSYNLSLLRRLAIRSMYDLHQRAEEISDTAIANSLGKS